MNYGYEHLRNYYNKQARENTKRRIRNLVDEITECDVELREYMKEYILSKHWRFYNTVDENINLNKK